MEETEQPTPPPLAAGHPVVVDVVPPVANLVTGAGEVDAPLLLAFVPFGDGDEALPYVP